jgi:hypothetical protein
MSSQASSKRMVIIRILLTISSYIHIQLSQTTQHNLVVCLPVIDSMTGGTMLAGRLVCEMLNHDPELPDGMAWHAQPGNKG